MTSRSSTTGWAPRCSFGPSDATRSSAASGTCASSTSAIRPARSCGSSCPGWLRASSGAPCWPGARAWSSTTTRAATRSRSTTAASRSSTGRSSALPVSAIARATSSPRASPAMSRCAWSSRTSCARSARARAPRSDMHLGMEVVRMVEAAELSLHHSGSAIPLNLPPGEQRLEPDRRRSDHGMPWFDGPTTLAPPPSSIDRSDTDRPPASRSRARKCHRVGERTAGLDGPPATRSSADGVDERLSAAVRLATSSTPGAGLSWRILC